MKIKKRKTVKRFYSMDFLRIVAIFLIVLFHVLYEFKQDNNLRMIGFLGVSLFFIISGFLLSKKYPDLEKFSLRLFLKRFFKIATIYYFALVTIFLLFGAQTYGGNGFLNLVVHFLFLDGFFPSFQYNFISPAWFFIPLIVFYLLFPYLNKFVKKYNLFLGIVFVAMILFRVYSGTWIDYSPLFFLGEFCFGIAFAHKKFILSLFLSLFLFIINPIMVLPYLIFSLFFVLESDFFNNKFVSFLSKNTIFIFLFHESFMKICFGKWNIFGTSVFWSIIILIFCSAFVFIFAEKLRDFLISKLDEN